MAHRLQRVAALVASTTLLLAIAIPATAADAARVRVLHASPDAPNVDIYLDDTKVDALTNVPFKAISAYLSVPSGAHNVKVVPTGGTVTDAVIDAGVTSMRPSCAACWASFRAMTVSRKCVRWR